MHEIEIARMSENFAPIWQAAGRHLNRQGGDGGLAWLKREPVPPFLEHLSFRIGNQLFFIQVEDVSRGTQGPGTVGGLLMVADGCKGHACLLPMRQAAGSWTPALPGWGLLDARSGAAVDPVALVTDERIEMTDWELHDFAVSVVRGHVMNDLRRPLMSFSSNPSVDPSLWFIGSHGPEWAIVRAARYPTFEAPLPGNVREIANGCSKLSRTGHFASVSVANADDDFDPDGGSPVLPLWRGHAMFIRFEGLVPVTVQ